MRLLGQSELADFTERHKGAAEDVRAWLSEIKHQRWTGPSDLARGMFKVDFLNPPRARFHVAAATLVIETIIDFKSGVVLVTGIQATSPKAMAGSTIGGTYD
jgi:mRNA-degrading endonuclease HigB of HigAB toxin-antitoxin module